MLVKDLMEEKKLNFNQPLLSVRRFSSKVAASETDNKRKTNDNSLAIPPYKSELKSGPVRKAGAIPFVWEKTPGRPKDETKLKTHNAIEQLPITPNLPPGRRVPKLKQQDSDMRTESTVSVSQNVVASLDEKVTKHEDSRKDGIEEKESCDSDDNETFLDALDTLSRTESFFMSCRMSGWDDDQVQPSGGSFSSDQQARDFIIDRFLPAAKAVASETPQFASSKKSLGGQGQKKQLKKVVSTEKSPPLNQHRPKSLWHYTQQDISRERSEDDNDYSKNYTTKACGLFPRLCLLNPIQGLRMEDKIQSNAGISTSSHIGNTKEHSKQKSVDYKSDFTKEKEILGILEKFKHGTDPHQRGCTQTSCESPLVEKTLYVDSVHQVKSQTNHKGDDFETLKRDNGIFKNLSVDSSLENSQYLDVINLKEALQAKISESLNNGMQMEMTNHSKKMDSEKLGNRGSDLHQDPVVISSPNSSILTRNSEFVEKWIDQECNLASSKVEDDGKIDLESQCVMKLGHEKISDATSYFEIPLVLPSLKAPSESWLKRTLPTISSRNISSRPNLAAKAAASLCPKWETIVKSSNVHHGPLQLHEELLKPIAED